MLPKSLLPVVHIQSIPLIKLSSQSRYFIRKLPRERNYTFNREVAKDCGEHRFYSISLHNVQYQQLNHASRIFLYINSQRFTARSSLSKSEKVSPLPRFNQPKSSRIVCQENKRRTILASNNFIPRNFRESFLTKAYWSFSDYSFSSLHVDVKPAVISKIFKISAENLFFHTNSSRSNTNTNSILYFGRIWLS